MHQHDLAWHDGHGRGPPQRGCTSPATIRTWYLLGDAARASAEATFDAVHDAQGPAVRHGVRVQRRTCSKPPSARARAFSTARARSATTTRRSRSRGSRSSPRRRSSRAMRPRSARSSTRTATSIVKPLDGMGGTSMFRVRADDPNRNVIVETVDAARRAHGDGAALSSRRSPTATSACC